jgi:hypothetical protein
MLQQFACSFGVGGLTGSGNDPALHSSVERARFPSFVLCGRLCCTSVAVCRLVLQPE